MHIYISHCRSNPYDDPEEVIPKKRKRKTGVTKGPRRDGFAARDSNTSSGIYEHPEIPITTPTEPKRKPVSKPKEPTPHPRESIASTVTNTSYSMYGETDEDIEDDGLPVELVCIIIC